MLYLMGCKGNNVAFKFYLYNDFISFPDNFISI